MKTFKFWRREDSRSQLGCLICGIDSGPVRNFMILVIGGLVGATLLIGLWAYFTGRFDEKPETGSFALKADEQERSI